MNGPAGMLSLVEMLSTDKVGPGDIEGIEKVLGDTLRERKRLQALHQKACNDYDAPAQSAREVEGKLKRAILKLNEARIAACDECGQNPAADSNALAAQLAPLEREVKLLQDALDLLTYVRLPDALDTKHETGRDLARIEHLEISCYAGHSHASMQAKMESAGFSKSHGRVVAVSETTERLKLAAAEALRQAQLADAQLTDARAARTTRTAARRASAQITAIEAALASLELSRSTEKE